MLLSGISILLLISYSLGSEEQPEQPDLRLARATAKFTNEVYKILSREEGNILFSPFGIHLGLSLLFQGANGGTKETFSNLTKLLEPTIASEGYGEFLSLLKNAQNVNISFINKAYVDATKTLKPAFKVLAKENFSFNVEPVDFSNSQSTVQQINAWVKEDSRGKIPKLLTEDELQDAILVLANSLSFNSTWRTLFKVGFATTDPFHVDDNNSNKGNGTLMHITARYHYKEDKRLNAEILELPFKNEAFSLVVILPKQRNGTADLEARLPDVNLNEITINSTERRVRVSLPKFKFGQTVDLVEILTEMGYGGLFNASSNLPDIVEGTDVLHIISGLQQSYIKVDENGTVAVATGAIRGTGSNFTTPTAPTVDFKADRPFLYMLTHQNLEIPGSRHILYFGRIHQPEFD